MRKKARFQELMEIEKKYLLLQEKEVLGLRRKEQLVEFVENIGNRSGGNKAKDCPHSSKLNKLASHTIREPEFAVADAVALTSDNSGMIKVSARGTDTLESGECKTLSGVICVDFTPKRAEICAASLYWTSPDSTSCCIFPPTVSIHSLE